MKTEEKREPLFSFTEEQLESIKRHQEVKALLLSQESKSKEVVWPVMEKPKPRGLLTAFDDDHH